MVEIAPRPYEPDVAIHPGATVRDVIEAKGMTQQELAKRMNRPPNKINEILQGKRAITVETALELELVLGWPADFWLEREKNYQLAKARLCAQAELQGQTDMLKKFPLPAMIRLGWIRKMPTPAAQVRELLAFFGIASFDQLDKPGIFAPAFRKAKAKEACPYALAAWLRRGTLQADRIETKPYSVSGLRGSLADLRALSLLLPEEFESRLVGLCAAHGVAVVFVPHLPGSYASGAAYWIGDKAVIQLSLLVATDDQFWFSFFHEVGHILLHGKKQAFLDDFKTDDNQQEQQANTFVARQLIPDAAYGRLKTLSFDQEAVVRDFAKEIGVAPGIVVGRLQHDRLLPHSRLRELKVRYAWRK
jgi:HTH-type transcriptional regulator/antitoxin HigA